MPPPKRILFIGNSFTTRNQLPSMLVGIAAGADPPHRVEVETVWAGGASLRRHWNAGLAQKKLTAHAWDVVVLQEQSTLPLKNPARYHENVRLFAAEIAARGARVALYETWSRQSAPQAQASITRAVREIASETGAAVIPVGSVWHDVLQRDPASGLYDGDGSHPTAAGSYLAACVFFVQLFGQPPLGYAPADAAKIGRDVTQALHAAAWSSRSA